MANGNGNRASTIVSVLTGLAIGLILLILNGMSGDITYLKTQLDGHIQWHMPVQSSP